MWQKLRVFELFYAGQILCQRGARLFHAQNRTELKKYRALPGGFW
jgi:hypothetical protein